MKKPSPVFFVDCEATNWSEFLFAVAQNVDTGEEYVAGTPAELAALVEEHGGQWLAHFGGGYDFLFIMDKLAPQAVVIPAGSRVLSATWHRKKSDFRATLRDTYPLWSKPLADIGEALGVEKLGGVLAPTLDGKMEPLDVSDLGRFEPSAIVEYCRRDVEIGVAAVKATRAYLAEYGIKGMRWTSGGAAVEIFSKLEPGARDAMAAARIPARDVQRLAESGLTKGGRVEVYRYGPVATVHKYDINSGYPQSMCEGALPIGYSPSDNGQPWAMRRIRFRRYDNAPPAPVLGQRADGKSLALRGTGDLVAWVTREELADIEGDPQCCVDEVLETAWPVAWIRAGEVFARHMFKRKSDGLFFAKLFLNSLHGKFSQRPCQVQFEGDGEKYVARHVILQAVIDDPAKPLTPVEISEKLDGLCPWHYQPLAAATIFGRARSRLYRAAMSVLRAGGEIYYCDTDSLHCSLSPEHFAAAGNTVGPGLGEWKSEGTGPGCYLAPKLYRAGYTVTGGPYIRAKGISRAQARLTGADFDRVAALPRYETAAGTYSEPDETEFENGGLSKFASSIRDGAAPFATAATRRLRVVATGRGIDKRGRVCYRP